MQQAEKNAQYCSPTAPPPLPPYYPPTGPLLSPPQLCGNRKEDEEGAKVERLRAGAKKKNLHCLLLCREFDMQGAVAQQHMIVAACREQGT